ncbi:MAG TPA: tetratricopeptide repeat-containing glycosyltransferase family protein [Azospirillaceae bacterium]|nr:tetratricopeptide repeat-containing glycosyltransferase family protein [Azospirillaceae bacterium]
MSIPADLLNRAVEHHAAGRLAEAEPLYRAVLAAGHPRRADILHNLSLLLEQAGRLPEAAAAASEQGVLLLEAGDAEGAAGSFRTAARLHPTDADTWSNLGNALLAGDRAQEAADACRRALSLRPDDPGTLSNLGNALRRAGDAAGAIAAYRRAVTLDPAFAGGWYNLGQALRAQDMLEEAEAAQRRAVDLDPSLDRAWSALGSALHDQGRLEEAVAAYDRSLALRPDAPGPNWNLALALLLKGDHARGWTQYEWRRRSLKTPFRDFPEPDWEGEPFPGRTLLVHAEQGMGDMLMIARYLPLVAARGGRVVLEAHQGLLRLFRGLPGVDALVPKDGPLPPFDLHVPAMSLARIFRAGIDPIPADLPYLPGDPELDGRWRRRLAGLPGLKVGLVWAGNPDFAEDRRRSPRLDAFLPLLDVPGVSIVGLQMGDGRRDLEGRALPAGFTDLGPEIGDFADTAAILRNLDLLVSSCTSPVHLAGALGRPVWVVLPRVPDWRWGMAGEGSAWYPTARLFRQEERGDWAGPVARVAAELARTAAGRERI